MSINRKEIEAFFADYAVALAGREPKSIAEYWAAPGLVLIATGANLELELASPLLE